jgi:hypothetical protein
MSRMSSWSSNLYHGIQLCYYNMRPSRYLSKWHALLPLGFVVSRASIMPADMLRRKHAEVVDDYSY